MCLNTNGNNIKLKLDKLGIISRDNKKKIYWCVDMEFNLPF